MFTCYTIRGRLDTSQPWETRSRVGRSLQTAAPGINDARPLVSPPSDLSGWLRVNRAGIA